MGVGTGNEWVRVRLVKVSRQLDAHEPPATEERNESAEGGHRKEHKPRKAREVLLVGLHEHHKANAAKSEHEGSRETLNDVLSIHSIRQKSHLRSHSWAICVR